MNRDAQTFLEILDSFDLVQHITEPTHKFANILDMIITKRIFLVQNHIIDLQLSDHNNILCYLNRNKQTHPKTSIILRKFKFIKLEVFKKDIKQVIEDCNKKQNNLEDLIQHYCQGLSNTLNKRAPEKTLLSNWTRSYSIEHWRNLPFEKRI